MRKHLAVEVARQWLLFNFCDVSSHTGGYIVLKETNTLAVSETLPLEIIDDLNQCTHLQDLDNN